MISGDLEKTLAKLNEKYNQIVVSRADKAKGLIIRRFSTGIFDLDRVLGGGVPIGRLMMIWGENSTGKSTTSLLIVSAFQKKFPDKAVVWLDAEGVYDRNWAEVLGVDNEKVFIVQTEYSEQAVDITDSLLRSGDAGLIVIDSLAALTPSKEIESSTEDWQVGLNARILNKGLRKFVSSLNAYGPDAEFKPTVILLNQVRTTMTLYGDPRVKPGGKGQEFATSIDLFMLKGKYLEENISGGMKTPVAVELRFVSKKNKTAINKQQGSFILGLMDYNKQKRGVVLDFPQLWSSSKKFGVITGSSGDWSFDGDTFRTQKEIKNFCETDKSARKRLRELTLEAINGRF